MIPRRTVREIPLGTLQPAEPSMTIPFEGTSAARLNARAVEFIAKPEKTAELRGLLCQAVPPLLEDRTGLIRSIILTAREEPRRVVMITLWSAAPAIGDRLLTLREEADVCVSTLHDAGIRRRDECEGASQGCLESGLGV